MHRRLPAIALLLSAAACGYTQTLPDTVQPLQSTVPADHAAGVPPNTSVTATLANNLDTATVTSKTFLVTQNGQSISGSASASGPVATFTPDAELTANSAIVATLTADVHYVNGQALPKAQSWTFTTGAALDHTPPTVVSTIPAADAIDVPPGDAIKVTFSEPMAALGNSAFTVKPHGDPTAVSGSVSTAGPVATFTPAAPLAQGILFDATVTTAAKDVSGNAVQTASSWSFTTAIIPFELSSAHATSATKMTLTFTAPPKTAEAAIAGNYCIGAGTDAICSNVVPVSAAAASGATVTLTTGVRAQATSYKVFVSGVTRDPDGISLQTNSATFTGFNLIANGSFDADTAAPPSGWTKTGLNSAGTLTAFASSTPAPFDGPNLARFATLSSTTGDNEASSSCFPIDATKNVTVSSYIYSPEPVANTFYSFKVYFFTDASCATAVSNGPSASTGTHLTAPSTWELHSFSQAPTAATATAQSAQVAIRARYATGTGTPSSEVDFDEVVVTQP